MKNSASVPICTLLGAMFSLISCLAIAQDQLPAFKNLRFEEDWSGYPAEGGDTLFDPIKKIELTDNIWMSMGGSLFTRIEGWNNFAFDNSNDDAFIFYRTFLHTDFHFGDHWRVFLQGRYAGSTERDLPGGRRDNLDVDYGDIWNTFIQADYSPGNVDMTIRLGRQELQYGKQRIISPLDWANTRRIWDGGFLRLAGSGGKWKADFWVTSPVILERDKFNEHDEERLFSGAYATVNIDREHLKGVDVYFLAQNGIDNPPVDEDRYTIATRIWGGIIPNLTYEVETAYQFGEREDMDINAFMITAETTYTFADTKWTPWVTLGAGYASGDDDPNDNDVETFNQVYPFGHFFLGFIDVIGRQNIIDLRLGGGAWVIKNKTEVRVDFHSFWRADDDDALYHAGGGVQRPATSSENHVGTEIDLWVRHKFNRHLSLFAGYSHFFAGDFIDDTGSDDGIDFVYSQFKFKF